MATTHVFIVDTNTFKYHLGVAILGHAVRAYEIRERRLHIT